MKNSSALIALSFTFLSIVPALAGTIREGSISGRVSDSMCTKNHAAMLKGGGMGATAADCARKCMQAGTAPVLIETKSQICFTVSNPKSLKAFGGKSVVVSGHIDDTTKMIHVHSVRAN